MYNYDFLNIYNSQQSPGTIHAASTELGAYFRRYLYQKAASVFEIECPEEWPKNYLWYVLYGCGFIAISDIPGYGVIPQWCTLAGRNVFYQPAEIFISNPAIKGPTVERTIGKDCVLLKLTPDYHGIADLIGYYADLMAVAAEGIGINILNSKLAYIFGVDNQAAAQSFKKMVDQINAGQPAVFIDKNLLDEGKPTWQTFSQDLRQNFIAPELMETMDKIERMFENEIGIPNTGGTEKKERLITDEVNANNVSTYSKAELWLENLRTGCEEANKMFGLDLSVDWREIKGRTTYGSESEIVSTGSVSVE